MIVERDSFYSQEQWVEHRNITRMGCRAVDKFETGSILWVRYSKGVGDHRFYIQYHGEGGTTILFEHASFDNVKTLRELLKVPKEVEHINVKRRRLTGHD